MADEITEPNVLAVEGKEEELFFGALIRNLGLRRIQIMDIAGKTNLRPRLKALASTPGFAKVMSLGVVRDANADPHAAFESVRGALQAANLPAPARPLVSVGNNPRVAVMILPGDDAPGALEDLCLRSVTQDPAMRCVEEYFQCLEGQGLTPPNNAPKARVQVFLGSRTQVGIPLGIAAHKGYWPLHDAAFEQVRRFLEQIGSEGTLQG